MISPIRKTMRRLGHSRVKSGQKLLDNSTHTCNRTDARMRAYPRVILEYTIRTPSPKGQRGSPPPSLPTFFVTALRLFMGGPKCHNSGHPDASPTTPDMIDVPTRQTGRPCGLGVCDFQPPNHDAANGRSTGRRGERRPGQQGPGVGSQGRCDPGLVPGQSGALSLSVNRHLPDNQWKVVRPAKAVRLLRARCRAYIPALPKRDGQCSRRS